MPIARMTVPRGLGGDFGLADVVAPRRLGRSWLLLGGLIPFDWDDIGIERIGPGFAFSERSTMLSQRAWHYDRRVEPLGEDACTVTDSHPLRAARARACAAAETPCSCARSATGTRRLRRRFGGPALTRPACARRQPAAASSVASKSVLPIGPTQGEVAPAAR